MEEKAAEVLPSSLLTQLASSNWKERLATCKKFQKVEITWNPTTDMIFEFVYICSYWKEWSQPRCSHCWKDSNFQVMKAKFSLVSIMVTTSTAFGKRLTACVLLVIVDKLADVKISKAACSYIFSDVFVYVIVCKSGQYLVILSLTLAL